MGAVVLGVAIQLTWLPGYSPDYDQSHVLSVARDFVENGVFPDHGSRNSLRAFNPPVFPWLYVPPMLVTHKVSWILILPALALHLAALLLTYRVGSRYFNRRVGALSVVLYAFSIQGLYFGHASWQQGLLAPFYVGVVFCLFRWLVDGRAAYSAAALVLCALTAGIHWGGLIAFAAFAVLAILHRRFIRPIPLAAGCAAAFLIWMPYLAFERERSFADVKAVVFHTPIEAPEPSEVSALCPVAAGADPAEGGGFKDRWKERLGSNRVAYQTARRVYHTAKGLPGLARAFHVNFHWDPFRGEPTAVPYRLLYLLEALVFGIAIGWLLWKMSVRRTASDAERLLLLSFMLPAILQNLSGYSTSSLSRPDVSWLFYGPQTILVSHALVSAAPARSRVFRTALILLLVAWVVWVSARALGSGAARMREAHEGRFAVVEAIAADLKAMRENSASIRYDFLSERPESCWTVSFGALDQSYSLGAEYNYLLESLYGIRNTGRVPDGMAADPDYVVVLPAGAARYDLLGGRYRAITPRGSAMLVLKVVK